MRKKWGALFFLIIILTACLIFLTKRSRREIYVPTVIVDASWGNAPEEFGIPDAPILTGKTGSESGPKYFTVTRKGNFYILDAVKRNIVVFNKTGKYIGTIPLEINYHLGTMERVVELYVDYNENIYIYPFSAGGYPWYFIDKYNKYGKLQKRFLFVLNERLYANTKEKYFKNNELDKTVQLLAEMPVDSFYGFRIFNDPSDNVFLSAMKKDGGEVVVNLSGKLEKFERKRAAIANTADITENFECGGSKNGSIYVQKINTKGEATTKIEIKKPKKYAGGEYEFSIAPAGEDTEGNIYVREGVRKYNVATKNWDRHESWTSKYDRGGNLLSTIDLKDAPGIIRGWDGRYYQIVWDLRNLRQRIKLIKWHPIKK